MGSSLTDSCQLGRRLFLYGLYKHCSIRPKNNRERTTHHRCRGPPPYSDKVETGMIKHCSIRPKNNRERTTHHRCRGPPPYSDKVETGMIKHCSIRPKNNRERTTHHRCRGPPPYSDKVETGMIGFATHQLYFKSPTQFRNFAFCILHFALKKHP